jgi:hypothetical protein
MDLWGRFRTSMDWWMRLRNHRDVRSGAPLRGAPLG